MNGLRRGNRTGSLVAGALAACCALAPAHAADWQFTPNAALSAGSTSNPRFLVEGSEDEQTRLAELGAQLSASTEVLELVLVPRLSFEQSRAEGESDRDYQFLTMKTAWRGERARVNGAADWAHDSTRTSELGTTGLVQDDYRREFLALSGGTSWSLSETLAVGANAQWSDTHYVDAADSGLVDSSRTSASVYASSSLSERTDLTLSARGGLLQSDGPGGRTRDASLTVGLSHELAPLWQVELAAGPALAEAGDNTEDGYLFSAGISHAGELTQFSAEAARRLDPLGTGYLAVMEEFTVGLRRQLSERASAAFGGRASRNRTLFDSSSAENQETRYYSVTGTFRWQFAATWSLWLDLENRVQEIGSAQSGSADSFRAYLGIAWSGRTFSL